MSVIRARGLGLGARELPPGAQGSLARRGGAVERRAEAGRSWFAPATLVLAALAWPSQLLAHGDGLAETALHRWTLEPITIALLIASALIYVRGLRALWSRAGVGRGIRVWQAASFGTALLSIAIALVSPVAWLSEVLFSVHMTQHEILMLVSAPLLVFGQPVLSALWAAPVRWREAAGQWAGRSAVASTWHALTAPLVVFVMHGLAIWVWHIPFLYEAALESELLHALEHICYVVTAALFWWAMVRGRYGRLGYGLAVLYVFLTAVHSSVLGALLVVAPGLLYPSYGAAAARWQIDAVQDQQLAGLLMWVPAGVIFIVLGLALLAAWLGESERRVRLGSTAIGSATAATRPLRPKRWLAPFQQRCQPPFPRSGGL